MMSGHLTIVLDTQVYCNPTTIWIKESVNPWSEAAKQALTHNAAVFNIFDTVVSESPNLNM